MKRPHASQVTLHHNWLPPCGFLTWSRVHTWTVEFAKIQLFGETLSVPKACLRERCTDLRDDEPTEDRDYEQCEKCELRTGSVHRRRRNTAYSNPEFNFVTQCDDCFAIEEEFWAEQWADYYAGQG